MNPENTRFTRDSGSNMLAPGSYIFKNDNLDKAIKKLQNTIAKPKTIFVGTALNHHSEEKSRSASGGPHVPE